MARFPEAFGPRTPCLVMAVFLFASGCAFLYGFMYRILGVLSSPFLGFWLLRSCSPSLSFSSSFSSGGQPGRLFLFFLLLARRTTDFRYLRRQELRVHMVLFFCLLSLPGSAAFPFSSPAFCLLSLSFFSLSLACKRVVGQPLESAV